jgi:hypothetical protein
MPPGGCNLARMWSDMPGLIHDLRREIHHQVAHTPGQSQEYPSFSHRCKRHEIKQAGVLPKFADFRGSGHDEGDNG